MKNAFTKFNLVAVSAATAETALNTEQTCDVAFEVDLGSFIKLTPRRETNKDQATGIEEQDMVYDLGDLSDWAFDAGKGQSQHVGLLAAYGLGGVSTAAAGGTGYLHTITPLADGELPTFTAIQKLSKAVNKTRFASMNVDSMSLDFSVDSWMKVSAALKGTGKFASDTIYETQTETGDVTQLTLSQNILDDDTDNVQYVKGDVGGGEMHYATITGASGNIVTFTTIGAGYSGNITWEVLYRYAIAWATLPARVTETPLRVSDLAVVVDGIWNGSTNILGGLDIGSLIKTFKWDLNNGLAVQFTPSGTGDYANNVERSPREQTVTMTRKQYDMMMANGIQRNQTMAISAKCEGAEYEAGYKYMVWVVLPKVGLTEVTTSDDGGKLSESITLPVLQHATYGSVIVFIRNQQDTYAA